MRLYSEGTAQPDASIKGSVEVFRNGFWGSVCAFGALEAAVLCRQLGLQGSAWASADTLNVTGRPVWINATSCNGTEASLLDCDYQPVNASSCGYEGTAVVQCYPIGEVSPAA